MIGYYDSGTVDFCLWNPESWALESRIQLKKTGIRPNDRLAQVSVLKAHKAHIHR